MRAPTRFFTHAMSVRSGTAPLDEAAACMECEVALVEGLLVSAVQGLCPEDEAVLGADSIEL